MKKSLLTLSVLGTFTSVTLAADVTIYGVVDTGLNYGYHDLQMSMHGLGSVFSQDYPLVDGQFSLKMRSGQYMSSRVGLKGREDLGNGLALGFVLENGFDSDTGKLRYDDRLFGREAQVNLSGSFGTIALGRMGALNSTVGSYNMFFGIADAFSGGWGDYTGGNGLFWQKRGVLDNAMTYVSPTFDGVTGYAQYSLNVDGQEGMKSAENERYGALGATYRNGALALAAMVDWTQYANSGVRASQALDQNDGYGLRLGGNYDFGFVRWFAGAEYVRHADNLGGMNALSPAFVMYGAERPVIFNGYTLSTGMSAPLMGGTALFSIQYTQGKTNFSKEDKNRWTIGIFDFKLKRLGVATGYVYQLSERTSLYGAMSYSYAKYESNKLLETMIKEKEKLAEAMLGLVHRF